MSTRVEAAVEVQSKNAPEVSLVECDDVVQAFAANRSNQALTIRILRGGLRREDDFRDTHVPDALLEHATTVANQLGSEPSARFRITKRQLRQPTIERMERFAQETQAEVIEAWKDPASLDSIREYLAGVRGKR